MTNTNTNVKQWKKEQYEVYASSFVDGDAILANGKWNKIYEEHGIAWGDVKPPLLVNETRQNVLEGNCYVFDSEYTDTPCEIATLDEYMPQDNDRVIWLGQHTLQFYTGKEDVVVDSEEVSKVKDGKINLWVVSSHKEEFIEIDVEKLPEKSNWGCIPRWDNVKEFDDHSTVNESTDNCEIKSVDSVIEAVEVLNDWYGKETTHQRLIEDLANMVSTVVLEGDYQLAQIGLNLIRQLEEEVK